MDIVRRAAGGALLKNGIKGVHEAFADYMLMNPGCRLREMAAHFGYTVPWICTVINSDIFKTYFSERRGDINVSIAEDLPTRLAAAAHLATERIIEVLEVSDDKDTIVDAFDKIMHRYGYAPNAKGGAQVAAGHVETQNVFYLSPSDLQGARAKLLNAHIGNSNVLEAQVVNGIPVPAT